MFLAIRLLTIITFTAHSAFGCCLTHGSCVRDQAETRANACCRSSSHENASASHEDASHENCEDEHEHGEFESSVNAHEVLNSLSESSNSQPINHEHHRHCEDAHCVFWVSHDAGGSLNAVSDGLVLWCGSLTGFKSPIRQCFGSRGPYRDPLPPSLCNRAILQVWLI